MEQAVKPTLTEIGAQQFKQQVLAGILSGAPCPLITVLASMVSARAVDAVVELALLKSTA